jgi:hypothetical protein
MDAACAPKAPGTYRIVMIGSSFAIGEGVPVEETIAGLLPKEIAAKTGKQIELYNQGMFAETPDVIAAHFAEALGAEPDLILWVLTPHDFKQTFGAATSANGMIALGSGVSSAHSPGLWELISEQLRFDGQYSTVVFLRHLFFANRSRYVRSYLAGASDAGFLRIGADAEWRSHLNAFDADDAEIESEAHAAGVPMLTVLLPNRAQAAMISAGAWPTGFDPYWLDGQLAAMVSKHSGHHIRILQEFHSIPAAETCFFEVNGHPKSQGSAFIARFLAAALVSEPITGLRNPSGLRGQ